MASPYKGYDFEREGAVISGPLMKTGRISSRWTNRLYIVKQNEMFYYETIKSPKPKKVVNLRHAQVIPYVKRDEELYGFMIQTPQRTYCLFASSHQESEKWMTAIKSQTSSSAAAQPSAPQKEVVEAPHNSDSAPPPIPPVRKSYSIAANRIEDLYEIKEELGSGGFSVVKRGIHKEDKTQWALKMIRNSVFQKNRERTEEEVSVLASLNHPGIVGLREVIRTPKYYVIVMELLCGGELFDRIVKREKYSENDAKKVARKILEAVRYLHEHNVVHRDLKPENLIFDKPGEDAELKLTDFGFATLYDGKQKLTATCGTPEYVAPEILDEKPYGKAVDMWSCGVIIYILLCGFPPFYAEEEQELFDRICSAKYSFISPYWDHVSADAKDLINHLLELSPKRRYTAEQALSHRWIKETSVSQSAPTADLSGALNELRRYNATRKFRKAVFAVLAANKLRNVMAGL